MARSAGSFSVSRATSAFRTTTAAPVLSAATRTSYAQTRPLVMPGDVFQGSGTAGYEETSLEPARISADKAAMDTAAQETSLLGQVPTWAWVAGAAGLIWFFMRGRGGGAVGRFVG